MPSKLVRLSHELTKLTLTHTDTHIHTHASTPYYTHSPTSSKLVNLSHELTQLNLNHAHARTHTHHVIHSLIVF